MDLQQTVLRYALLAGVIAVTNTVRAAPQAFLVLPNGTTNYSSGINLDVSNADLSYALTSLAGAPASNVVSKVAAGHLSGNTSHSAWISPFGANQHIDDITLSVGTTLDLTGVDLSNNVFTINGYWVSDNQGLEIYVNGVPTAQTNNGAHGNQPNAIPANRFAISSAHSPLVSGENTVEFLWGNGGAGGADPNWPSDPTAVRIELDSYTVASIMEVSIARLEMNGSAVIWWSGNQSNLIYRVESCTNLSEGAWSPAAPTSQWWVSESTWTNAAPGRNPEFFRVRAADP